MNRWLWLWRIGSIGRLCFIVGLLMMIIPIMITIYLEDAIILPVGYTGFAIFGSGLVLILLERIMGS